MDCTFEVVFTSSPMGTDDPTVQVDVSAGGVITIDIRYPLRIEGGRAR